MGGGGKHWSDALQCDGKARMETTPATVLVPLNARRKDSVILVQVFGPCRGIAPVCCDLLYFISFRSVFLAF